MYNLLTNNERYGNLRLTPLFQDYVKEEGTLGNNYIHYATKFDSGEIKLFDIDQTLLRHPEYTEDLTPVAKETLRNRVKKEIENDILFYAFNDRGALYVDNSRTDARVTEVNNSDFVVVTSVSESEVIKKKWAELHQIKSLLKNNGFIIKFEC